MGDEAQCPTQAPSETATCGQFAQKRHKATRFCRDVHVHRRPALSSTRSRPSPTPPSTLKASFTTRGEYSYRRRCAGQACMQITITLSRRTSL